MFPDDYDADERDEDDGVRESVTLDDGKKVWAVHNAPTKPTVAEFMAHVYIRPDGRGKIAKDFTAAKTPITKPAKPLGEWNHAAAFSSLPSDDDEEEEEVDLTKVVDSSNVTVRHGQKAPRDEEEHKHSDGNRKRASEYTPKSASKNKKHKNGKDEVDDEDDDASTAPYYPDSESDRDDREMDDEGDQDHSGDERPVVRDDDDDDDKTNPRIKDASPDELITELKSRKTTYRRTVDAKKSQCDEEEKQFIKQAYVAYRRRAFCRYKPGDMPDPCIEYEEEEESDPEAEDEDNPGYAMNGLLLDLRARKKLRDRAAREIE